ncbi:trigger factor-related chaperone [Mycoplasmopsis gallinarum]|uniref:Trigger factor C-terminal domain-containing protein n=1 Tax=Mycoplasmopsis gallinarum TaxID=29557 RepID=A0A168RD75_9BACT|nr:hypothetical protein [Mycoplasmopsis gallinarum]OAB48860.1 hypothetical protein MGALLINA_04310 [Mycoplasmopsis gallinarum]
MINNITKTIEINLSNSEWKKVQNEVLSKALLEKRKINQNQILELATKTYVDKILQNLKTEIDNDYPRALNPIQPLVLVEKINNNEFVAKISISFYPYEEIQKLNFDNITINFDYEPLSTEILDKNFKEFIKNYPILKSISTEAELNDLAFIDFEVTKEEKVVDRRSNFAVNIVKTNNFSIANFLIGKKTGETFSINDPENRHWKIFVRDIQRKEKEELTDEKLKNMNLQNLDNIEDLRDSIFKDFRLEYDLNQLLYFYKETINKLFLNNSVQYSIENLNLELSRISQLEQMRNTPIAGKNITELRESSDLAIKNIVDKIDENTKLQIFENLVEYFVFKENNMAISNEELRENWEYLERTQNLSQNLDSNRFLNLLKSQKVALFLCRKYNELFYNYLKDEIYLNLETKIKGEEK